MTLEEWKFPGYNPLNKFSFKAHFNNNLVIIVLTEELWLAPSSGSYRNTLAARCLNSKPLTHSNWVSSRNPLVGILTNERNPASICVYPPLAASCTCFLQHFLWLCWPRQNDLKFSNCQLTQFPSEVPVTSATTSEEWMVQSLSTETDNSERTIPLKMLILPS